jgi:hypothetical protein
MSMKAMLGLTAAIAAMHGQGLMPVPIIKPATPKPTKKCARPSCENQTSHNGGYCSADCCKQHQKERQSAVWRCRDNDVRDERPRRG